MQINVKTLKNKVYTLDYEAETTVLQLKEMLNKECATLVKENLKLIYSGAILKDSQKCGDFVDANGKKFVVAMVQKPKKPASTEASSSSAAENKTPATEAPATATPAPAAPASTPQVTETTSTTASTEAPSANQSNESVHQQLVTPENFEETVGNLSAMGFPRDQVEAALKACNNNPDLALDFLEGGADSMGQMLAQQSISPASGGGNAAAAGQGAGMEQFQDIIRSNPQLQQMMQAIQQNPALLQQYMSQISQQNPDLLQFIAQNQGEFINAINQSQSSQESVSTNQSGGNQQAAAGAPQQVRIEITPEERADINSIISMGFSEQASIEAYFMCEKNVQNAVNFLLQG